MGKKKDTTNASIQPSKPDDGWDLPISREELQEILYDQEQERAVLETLAEEERMEEEERQRRSRNINRFNDPYIFDSYGISEEDLEEPVDLYEW